MTQSGCAILERRMGGNGGRNLAAQRSKQLFWNQESVPWSSILPEFSRIKRNAALLLLHLQTAFTWACWAHSCQAVWCVYLTKVLRGHPPACAMQPHRGMNFILRQVLSFSARTCPAIDDPEYSTMPPHHLVKLLRLCATFGKSKHPRGDFPTRVIALRISSQVLGLEFSMCSKRGGRGWYSALLWKRVMLMRREAGIPGWAFLGPARWGACSWEDLFCHCTPRVPLYRAGMKGRKSHSTYNT